MAPSTDLPNPRRPLTPGDILAPEAYAPIRAARRAAVAALKKHRRVPVGPDAAAYFECHATMRHQVQEMVHVERGGMDQILDELAAYNPLIPNGRELVATVMFEITDEARRREFLAGLGGIEETMFLRIASGGNTTEVRGVPETDVDRTTADGKASSVQFIHLPFTEAQIAAFRAPNAQVTVGFTHPAYGHMAVLGAETRAALAADFAPAA